jgi:hypothetical protein
MADHATHQPHGSGIRGLSSLKNIDNKNDLAGKFGRTFKRLSPTNFLEEDPFKFGDAMIGADIVIGVTLGCTTLQFFLAQTLSDKH